MKRTNILERERERERQRQRQRDRETERETETETERQTDTDRDRSNVKIEGCLSVRVANKNNKHIIKAMSGLQAVRVWVASEENKYITGKKLSRLKAS